VAAIVIAAAVCLLRAWICNYGGEKSLPNRTAALTKNTHWKLPTLGQWQWPKGVDSLVIGNRSWSGSECTRCFGAAATAGVATCSKLLLAERDGNSFECHLNSMHNVTW